MPVHTHHLTAPALFGALCALAASAWGQSSPPTQGWQAGVVLDVASSSKKLELGARDPGTGLGHSDLLLRGSINQHLSAEAILGFHTADRRLEHHLENAWIQTRSLPQGFQLRAGRFASQIGYLNELHPHTDDFTERPLLYRGFLGGHWYDDGLRMNWTAPTPFYLRLGAEMFGGKKLVPHASPVTGQRVSTLNLKLGHDLGRNSSWQWGLSTLHNPRTTPLEEHEETGHAADHSHAARFTGQKMHISDLVWKWSPQGNNRNQQVRLTWEYAQVSRIHPLLDPALQHTASSVGAVWRFHPAWEVGARSDWARVHQAALHAGETEVLSGRLRENALMLAYKPTHSQTLRLQLTQQSARNGHAEEAVFAHPAKRSLQLQYVVAFGAHGAHAY